MKSHPLASLAKIIAFLAFASASASADGTFTRLDPESLASEDGRAEVSISTYSVRNVDWSAETAKIAEAHTSTTCGEASVQTDMSKILKNLSNFFEETRLADAMKKLHRQGEIAYAVGVSDGADGDSESCSQTTVRFYSEDGEVLDLFFDYNT